MMSKKEKEAFQTVYKWFMEEKARLDFIEKIIETGIPIGFKPDFHALVGTVYTKSDYKSIRDLIDKLMMINNGELQPDADTSESIQKDSSVSSKDQGT